MEKPKKMSLGSALLVAVLSFGGFMGVATVVSNNSASLTPVSLAKDGESNSNKGGDSGENKDEDKESKSEKKEKEEAKKQSERQREATKKTYESSDDGDDEDDDRVNGVKLRGDGSVDDDQNEDSSKDDDEENEGEDNGMFKDRSKTIEKLTEKLAEAEKEILEKQAEGVDVTSALARLAEAKAKIVEVGGAFDANDLESAKDLAQEVSKLTHFAKEKDLHDAKEVAEDVAKISKRITQAYGKIALLEAVGGDGSDAKEALVSLEADLTALKAIITAGGYDGAVMEKSLETLERKVKAVKGSIEGAIYALGGTDGQYDDDYENETEDVVDNLRDVADIEDDNIGQAVRRMAQDQEDSAKKVGEVVSKIDDRNVVAQTLLGASEKDLSALEQEIADNKARALTLTQVAETMTDPDIKTILMDQVAVLNGQTAKLETFVSGQRDRLSVFGWFFHLFQK